MDLLAIIVVLGAALASVAVYAMAGRVLPGRWRKTDVEESEGFAIESVNVLIGLLFSILLAFLIATVLSDYDKASSDAQDEATLSARSRVSPGAYQDPLKPSGKTTARITPCWSSTTTGR
jgi:hypothetical protein